MKTSTAAALGSVLAGVAHSQVVQWGIERRQLTNPDDLARLKKRASTLNTQISNDLNLGGYFTDCEVGTPGQKLSLLLDTGSSDIWVPSSSASICKSSTEGGCPQGSFTSSKSSTFKDVGKGDFDITYVDGSSSSGDYFTDVFTIGGSSLTNMTMGLGLSTSVSNGVIGVGYASDEAIVGDTHELSSAYVNLPQNMVAEGIINTNAYSLWLNDLDSNTGTILFGGIDTAKYKGDLTRIQVQPTQPDIFTAFQVYMTSLRATSSSGSDALSSRSFPISAVLDSGTTLTYLPDDIAEQAWKEAGAVYEPDAGVALVPCSLQNSGGFFTYGFAGPNGPQINVSMSELVVAFAPEGRSVAFPSGVYQGQTACTFGIQNTSSDPFLLGDTFLRSAYVVYDLINNEVAIAPTDFNATGSNVVAFASSGAPIPSATLAPNQNQATQSPAFTTPAFAAEPGFSDTASGTAGGSGGSSSSSKNASPGLPPTFDMAQLAVLGAAMALTLTGSGLFMLF